MTYRDLTNKQWQRLEPLLPPQKPKTGRKNLNHRRIINGILWILRTGAPWDDLPRRCGKRGTVSSRYYRWCKQGIWAQIFADLQAQADAEGTFDWTLHFVDGTVIRAHQHAAGAKDSDAQTEALGRSQGGFSTKRNIRADGQDRPINFVLQQGQAHESQAFEALMEHGAVKRTGGTCKRRPLIKATAASEYDSGCDAMVFVSPFHKSEMSVIVGVLTSSCTACAPALNMNSLSIGSNSFGALLLVTRSALLIIWVW